MSLKITITPLGKFSDVSATPTIAERAAAYCAWGRWVDAINVQKVFEVAGGVFKHVRGGNGPAILEATCCRFRGYYEGDHDTYRSRQERKAILTTKDPIKLARRKIIDQKIMQSNALDKLEASSKVRLSKNLENVRADPLSSPQGLIDNCLIMDFSND